MITSLAAFVVLALAPEASPQALAGVQSAHQSAPLASESLAAGRKAEALATLTRAVAEDPNDPAILINLGIALAQQGDDAQALAAFEQALSIRPVDLDIADGTSTDSRRLARKAIRMLERGEFRVVAARKDQLTLRD